MKLLASRLSELVTNEGFSFVPADSPEDYHNPRPARLLDHDGDQLCQLSDDFVSVVAELPDAVALTLLKQVHAVAYSGRGEDIQDAGGAVIGLAKFRNVLHGYDVFLTEEDKKYRRDVVQISEYVAIEFPPLVPGAAQQTEALNVAEQEVRAQFQTKLDQIAAARTKLQGAQS